MDPSADFESGSPPDSESSERGWRWLWIGTAVVIALIVSPTIYTLHDLKSARAAGDLPRALAAVRSLTDGFFGPLLSPWLDEVGRQIRQEVITENLESIQRLVPDTEESAYAEMELGRLALNQGNAEQAILHLERYLKSRLGRDIDRARLDISDAYREVKRYGDAEAMLKIVLGLRPNAELFAEASFRMGELYQFHLNRPQDALSVYRAALSDTSVKGRWRNDMLTNVALLKE